MPQTPAAVPQTPQSGAPHHTTVRYPQSEGKCIIECVCVTFSADNKIIVMTSAAGEQHDVGECRERGQ